MKFKILCIAFAVFSMQAQEASKTSKTVVSSGSRRRYFATIATNKGDITVKNI
jgi:hypothetical protein